MKTYSKIHNGNANDLKFQSDFEKDKLGGLALWDCKSYKPAVIKTVWYWSKDRQTDQWNRIKSVEIDQLIYSWFTTQNQMHFYREGFKQMMLEQIDSHMKKQKELWSLPHTIHTKITSIQYAEN